MIIISCNWWQIHICLSRPSRAGVKILLRVYECMRKQTLALYLQSINAPHQTAKRHGPLKSNLKKPLEPSTHYNGLARGKTNKPAYTRNAARHKLL